MSTRSGEGAMASTAGTGDALQAAGQAALGSPLSPRATGNSQFPETPREKVSGRVFKDNRDERTRTGLIKYRKEQAVPDVGGTGWRTRQGHVLKNQAYYRIAHDNYWNDPVHGGRESWASWHGPRLRTDAPMMDTLDRMDEQGAEWEARKKFVDTTRLETLDRFYNKKMTTEQHEMSSSWAPHHRARREVHDFYDTFGSDLAALPVKELKKILTTSVLNKDQEAIGKISVRMQQEEAWKMAYKTMESERRADLLEDLRRRRVYNDMLTKMAGQPVRGAEEGRGLRHTTRPRISELAEPKKVYAPEDITEVCDSYRGLIHADFQLALESLFPGTGTQDAMMLRAQVTSAASPKNSPHETMDEGQIQAHIQRKSTLDFQRTLGESSEHAHKQVPVAAHRKSEVAFHVCPSKTHPGTMEQTLATKAPPAPKAAELRGREDLPKGKPHDRHRPTLSEVQRPTIMSPEDPSSPVGTGSSAKRASLGGPDGGGASPARSVEKIPPLRKQFTYGVSSPVATVTRERSAAKLAEREIKTKPGVAASGTVPTGRSDGFKVKKAGAGAGAPRAPKRSLFSVRVAHPLRGLVPSPPSGAPSSSGPASRNRWRSMRHAARPEEEMTAMDKIGYSSAASGFAESAVTTIALCKALDAFEEEVDVAGRLGNEYKTIHGEPIRMMETPGY